MYYGQQNPYQYRNYSQPSLSGRMVTSKEEALGVPADFTNGCTFMPDLSHDCNFYFFHLITFNSF